MEMRLNQQELETIVEVFSELGKMEYTEVNKFLGSMTIDRMVNLESKIETELNIQGEEDDWEDVDDDYSSNCTCDTSGICGGPSCSQYYSCYV